MKNKEKQVSNPQGFKNALGNAAKALGGKAAELAASVDVEKAKVVLGDAAKTVGGKAAELAASVDVEKAKAVLGDTAKTVGGKAAELAASVDVEKAKAVLGDAAKTVGSKATVIAGQAKQTATHATQAAVDKIDANGNGKIDVEDIIIWGLRVPGIRVDRSSFLRAEFTKYCEESVIEDAIARNPARAGVTPETIDKIADAVIQYERNCVSGISAALGMPGGVAMAATIPADLAQYYGYTLRAAQKLMYLYGFPAIDIDEKGSKFDTETMNILTLCLGVMYGAAGANNAIKAMARALGAGVEKKLLRTALTKGTLYPIVKSVAHFFNVKMTKTIFADFFKNAIPVVGGVLGGGLTYLSFKPCCDKLKASLQDTILSNPAHQADEAEERLSEAIFVDAESHEVAEEFLETAVDEDIETIETIEDTTEEP